MTDLSWSIPANLRWLADQPDRPDYVPAGMLTGVFLNLAADAIESLARSKPEPNAARLPEQRG